MTHFKNVELAAQYGVSESTVRNWVKLAKNGKVNLVLSHEGGRDYVANNPANIKIVEKLAKDNRKYRNTNTARTVSPLPEFYSVFNQAQIYDIVRNLEMRHEIPRQYNYFDGGAVKWDVYVQQLAEKDAPNLLNRTVDLIAEGYAYIDKRLAKYQNVSVVDVGVGNALPSRELLRHLFEQNKLRRYIAIDISTEMLEIAQKNIKKWFGASVAFEGYQLDITFERFANILAEEYLKKRADDAVNLVLFLGGTADNLRIPDDAFRTINESMNPNDLLLYTNKLEKSEMRPQWFDNISGPGKLALAPMHRLVFDLLNLDESLYDVEMGFNEPTRQRLTRARLKFALTIKFDFEEGERVIEFEKGDTIVLWRSWQMTATDVARQFERNGFYALHTSQSEDREYILTVAEVNR